MRVWLPGFFPGGDDTEGGARTAEVQVDQGGVGGQSGADGAGPLRPDRVVCGSGEGSRPQQAGGGGRRQLAPTWAAALP